MILSDSPLGIKRRLLIVGILQWSHVEKFMIPVFQVECIDANGALLIDKAIQQSREVRYVLRNSNMVDANFNPVETGGTGEYDYFFNLVNKKPPTQNLPDILSLLSAKLNERGIFN